MPVVNSIGSSTSKIHEETQKKIRSSGWVALVGAGPGDPGLLTLRGKQLLDQADVIVHDQLLHPELLSYRTNAQYVFVGKSAGHTTLPQPQIEQVLIDLAKSGKGVVRLKGGDPFTFGRGGEECQALAAAGVRFEVVPGVTAAAGAAAYAGIPLTHRDTNSAVLFFTGHAREGVADEETGLAPPLDWSALAKLPALVMYMGVKSLAEVLSKLLAAGLPAETPAAAVQWATWDKQRTVTATAESLAAAVASAGINAPAILFFGKQVLLRDQLDWAGKRPLAGKTVLVTRTGPASSDLRQDLRNFGARVVEAPMLHTLPNPDLATLAPLLLRLNAMDCIVLASWRGVESLKDQLQAAGLDVRALGRAKLAAVGRHTADACWQMLGVRPEIVPQDGGEGSRALLNELQTVGMVTGKRLALIRADVGLAGVAEKLLAGGAAEVIELPVYLSTPASEIPPHAIALLRAGEVDWITFTSGLTARRLIELLGPEKTLLTGIKRVSIGPMTSQTLAELGFPATVQAATSHMGDVADAIVSYQP